VAHTLDVHRRTLHRRLRQQGTSFRQVLDEIRYDTARHLLQLTDMPLLQVATSLGYSDVTTFTRAFKRWSGASPGRYRDDMEAAG
jgi:AraC-like DNA-binding protein